MLVLSRSEGEAIVIDERIRVQLLKVKGRRARFGVSAPPSVPVRREELEPREGDENLGNYLVSCRDTDVSLPARSCIDALVQFGNRFPSIVADSVSVRRLDDTNDDGGVDA